MKTILFAIIGLLSTAAHAVDINCPAKYPSEEAPLSAVPSGHKGSGIIRGARLTNAYISVGKLHHDPTGYDAMELVPKVIKGGWQENVNFTPNEKKWIVCIYGGGLDGTADPLDETTGPIEWWEQIDQNIARCALKVMKIKFPASNYVEYTATATCK